MTKTVLITGASSGMGREAAILLAQAGHRVYAGARRADRLEELASYGIVPVQMDVTSEEDCQRVVTQMIEAEGRIDVLINNAGFGLYGPMEDISIEDARYQFEVNLFGLARLTQLVLPHMRAQRAGRIVNISSMGGRSSRLWAPGIMPRSTPWRGGPTASASRRRPSTSRWW